MEVTICDLHFLVILISIQDLVFYHNLEVTDCDFKS